MNKIELIEKFKFTGLPLNDKATAEDKLRYMNGVLERAVNAAGAEGYKEACQKIFSELDKKMGSLDISGGAYGQLKNIEHTEQSRTISVKDYHALKSKYLKPDISPQASKSEQSIGGTSESSKGNEASVRTEESKIWLCVNCKTAKPKDKFVKAPPFGTKMCEDCANKMRQRFAEAKARCKCHKDCQCNCYECNCIKNKRHFEGTISFGQCCIEK